MRTALTAILFSLTMALLAKSSAAQTSSAQVRASNADGGRPPVTNQPDTAPPGPTLNAILADLQRAAQTTNADLARLRIDKWKTDEPEKQRMLKTSASLQKNIAMAVPVLLNDVQATPGSVFKAFRLYDDVTVLYEYLASVTEAAGAFGKKEEYSPLESDTSALNTARQNLSSYIEQAANNLETQAKQRQAAPPPTPSAQASQGPKKIVIDDDAPSAKKVAKKKKPSPAPSPTPAQ